MSLEEVFERATIAPARIIGEADRRGHLRVGATADIAVWTLHEGEFDFFDSFGQKLTGRRKLACQLAVRAGGVWFERDTT